MELCGRLPSLHKSIIMASAATIALRRRVFYIYPAPTTTFITETVCRVRPLSYPMASRSWIMMRRGDMDEEAGKRGAHEVILRMVWDEARRTKSHTEQSDSTEKTFPLAKNGEHTKYTNRNDKHKREVPK